MRNRQQHGSVLALTLMFLVLISLFAMAFWRFVPVELHSAKRQMLETEAYFASDAGIVDTLDFLQFITASGNVDNYFTNNGVENADGHLVIRRTGQLNGWNWTADVIPGPETFGNATNPAPNPLRVYNIVSVARRPGISGDSHQYRRVSAWVRQKTFADKNWALSEYSATAAQLWLFMDTFKLGGDYHTNGPGLLRIEDTSLWSNTQPAIKGDFSFVVPTNNPTIGYVDGVRYSSWGADKVPYHIANGPNQGLPNGDRYEKISGNGRAGIKATGRREMPINTDSVAFGVWGDTVPSAPLTDSQTIFGATSDVKMAINGATPGGAAKNGVYIEGNVKQIEYKTNSNTYLDPTGGTWGDNGDNPADMDNTPEDENQIIRIYGAADPNRYVELTHVMGRPFTIPTGASVVNNTHLPGATLQPTDNGGKGYTVAYNKSTNQYAVFTEQTNGAIFATGNVDGVKGVVKGRRTVGVSTDSGTTTSKDKQIVINGELLYAGTMPGTPPEDANSMLGLIGYAVRMQDAPALGAPTEANPQFDTMFPARNTFNISKPQHLYTSIFAGRRNDPAKSFAGNGPILQGGGFGSESPGDPQFGKGYMLAYGSITEGIRQWKGTGNTAGNHYAFQLDPNLQEIQPPFFPTLPDYDIIAWEEKSVFSY